MFVAGCRSDRVRGNALHPRCPTSGSGWYGSLLLGCSNHPSTISMQTNLTNAALLPSQYDDPLPIEIIIQLCSFAHPQALRSHLRRLGPAVTCNLLVGRTCAVRPPFLLLPTALHITLRRWM